MSDRMAVLARLARLAATDPYQRHLVERLCEASRLILGADGAWITVENANENRTTLTSTDRVAARLADLQDVLGEARAARRTTKVTR